MQQIDFLAALNMSDLEYSLSQSLLYATQDILFVVASTQGYCDFLIDENTDFSEDSLPDFLNSADSVSQFLRQLVCQCPYKSQWYKAVGIVGATHIHKSSDIHPYWVWLTFLVRCHLDGLVLSKNEFTDYLNEQNSQLQLKLINILSSNKSLSIFDSQFNGDGMMKALDNPDSKALKHFADRKMLKRVAPTIAVNEMSGLICEPPDLSDDTALLQGKVWSDTRKLYFDIINSRQAEPVQGKPDFEMTVLVTASETKYHPVRDTFLERCYQKVFAKGMTFDNAYELTSNLCSHYFRTDVSIYDRYLQKAFLEGVYMVYEPGYVNHSMTWLMGCLGCGKTGFLRAMAMDDSPYYSYMQSAVIPSTDSSSREEWYRFSSAWLVNFDDVDKLYHANSYQKSEYNKSALSEFVGVDEITFKSFYGKDLQTSRRAFMLFATGKDLESPLLQGKTSSAYQVIRLDHDLFDRVNPSDTIDFKHLYAHREEYWGAFVYLYKNSYKVTFDENNHLELETLDNRFNPESPEVKRMRSLLRASDKEHEKISAYYWFRLEDIREVLNMTPTELRRNQTEMSKALKHLGFIKKRIRYKGYLESVWYHPDYNPNWRCIHDYNRAVDASKVQELEGWSGEHAKLF